MTKSTLLLGTMLGLGLAAPAMAQSAAQPAGTAEPTNATPPEEQTEPAAPAEIVVTAQKRSERLQDVPVAVSVVSGAVIDGLSRPSIEGASQLVPALNYQKSGTTLNQSIFMRGVGTATFSIAGEPSVSTVVDGVVYARSGEAFSDLVDIDRIEVLRGPQGTLFGKNASAGVINIVTRMPVMGSTAGSAEIGYFTDNEIRLKSSFNVPFGDKVAGRVTAFYGNYDGFIRNRALGGEKVNGFKRYGARAQLLFEPSDTVRLYAAADYHKNEDDCCAQIIAIGPLTGAGVPTTSPVFSVLPTPRGSDTREINQNLVTATRESGWGTSLQADVDIGEHTLTSITAYRDFRNTEIRDGDWLPMAYVGFGQLHDRGPQKSDTFTQEIRLASPVKQFLSYVVGAFYSNAYSRRVFTREGIVCNAAPTAPTGVLIPCGTANAAASRFPRGTADFGSRFKNFALFGQATANINDAFRLIGGLRYSNDRLSVFHKRVSTGLDLNGSGIPTATGGTQPNFDQGVYNRYLELLAAGQAPGTAAANAVTASNGVPFRTSTKADNVSGKAVVQYDIDRNVMAYASYTRGYKGPAYNILYGTTSTSTNALEPETSDSWEAGLKNTLLGGKMVLNIAAFRADYHNFQANNPDLVAGVVVARFTNAGEVSTRGVELDLSYRPVRDLTINGGLAYTKAKVDRFKAPAGATPAQLIPDGTPLLFAPRWKGSLSADYRVRDMGPINLWLGGSTTFQSKQLSIFDADPVRRRVGTIPKYALFNASLGVGDEADTYRLTFQVRNLTDKSFFSHIEPGGPAGSYRYQITRDADRYVGITGRVNFGGSR